MPMAKKPQETEKKSGRTAKTTAPFDLTGVEKEKIEAAQEIMYEAWETASRRKRIALARKALNVSPFCADAYVLLAQEDAKSLEEELTYFQKGVKAGELALGKQGFEEYAGHFWGVLDTRPYMRAREGLASALWRIGRQREAIGHFRKMLKLNPNDNQGIRYVLAAHLLELGETAALKKLFKKYNEDGSASWLYTQALLAFQDKDPKANQIAEDAWQSNDHVPGILAGTQPGVAPNDGYVTMGGADEATCYVEDYGDAWKAAPGAIDWLVSVTSTLPRRKWGAGHRA